MPAAPTVPPASGPAVVAPPLLAAAEPDAADEVTVDDVAGAGVETEEAAGAPPPAAVGVPATCPHDATVTAVSRVRASVAPGRRRVVGMSRPYKRPPSGRGESDRPGMITGVRTALRYLGGAVLIGLLVVAGTWVRVGQIGAQDLPVGADGAVATRADAIVVPGAAQYDGRPSSVFRARLDHAAQLYRDGVAAHIVTIGGGQPDDRTTEGQAGLDYLAAAGIDESALTAVGTGGDTVASLRAAEPVLAERGWSSVVLVTDPAHSARAALMARDLGWAVQTSPVRDGPAVEPAVQTDYRLRETLGVLYYRLTGGPSGLSAPVF